MTVGVARSGAGRRLLIEVLMKTDPNVTARVGLCASCAYMRVLQSDRNAIFYQCRRAAIDPRFPQYPRLPVLTCSGYEVQEGSERQPKTLTSG